MADAQQERAARRLAPVAARLERPRYIWMKDREIIAVYCAPCGAQIRGMIADRDYNIIRQNKGVTIIQERLRLACNAAYREVLMEMDDGSRHVTNVCLECAEKMRNDAELREAVYAADLASWAFDGGFIHETYFTRSPIRVVRIANVIE